MPVAVDVFVTDKTVAANPIADVGVAVFDVTGATHVTSGTTSSEGVAAFLLPEDTTYQLRFFKSQVIIKNPVYIEVLAAPAVNQFDVKGEPFSPPVSSDARLCIASGYFRRGDGGPARYTDIEFIARFNPLLLDGAGVVQARISTRTDEFGYAQVPLIRNGQYNVLIQGLEDLRGIITVPDLSSCSLPNLLWPVVESVALGLDSLELSIGEEMVLTPVVYDSAGVELDGTAVEDMRWSLSDSSKVALYVTPTQITLRGIEAGETVLIGERLDNSIIRIPNTAIQGLPITITVVE